jgi:hypothetical protein
LLVAKVNESSSVSVLDGTEIVAVLRRDLLPAAIEAAAAIEADLRGVG